MPWRVQLAIPRITVLRLLALLPVLVSAPPMFLLSACRVVDSLRGLSVADVVGIDPDGRKVGIWYHRRRDVNDAVYVIVDALLGFWYIAKVVDDVL